MGRSSNIQKRNSLGPVLCLLVLVFAMGKASGQDLSVSDNYIAIYANTASGIFGIGTSATYSLPDASLMYCYPASGCTSHIVAWINGTVTDYASGTTTSSLAVGNCNGGTANCMSITKNMTANVYLTAHYEIVNNPQTGVHLDTAMMQFTYTNNGPAPATVGLRVEMDTMINGNDGANISNNNGLSTVPTDTLYTANSGSVSQQWWGYDVPPPGVANLVGMGTLYNNGYGVPATHPDAMEIAYWSYVSAAGQWTTGTLGTSIYDSAVVLWWTGSGNNTAGNIVLNSGQSVTFTTYLGLNQIALLTTPTFTPTPTPSGPTPTPTITATPTATIDPAHCETLYVAQNLYKPDSQQPVSIFASTCQYPGDFHIWIYNSAGEFITSLDDRHLDNAWEYPYHWDGTNSAHQKCASGVYLIYLVKPYGRELKRLLLVR